MIARIGELATVRTLTARYPVVAILGARQVGKTTLARELARGLPKKAFTLFDLENPGDLARLDDPMLALEPLRGLVIIDEVQRTPELFPVLRVLADRPRAPARFLLLGSASPGLLRQSSESLAGRIHYHELEGFGLAEVGPSNGGRLWLRGGFPRSYLARSEAASFQWRLDLIGTFLERDLPQLGSRLSAHTLRRFWTMLAHYHGQLWNSSEFARSFGVADTTVRHYLDVLCSIYLTRQLLPWRENLKKRQVASPKVYLTDSGLLHALLGVTSQHDLEGHPKVGSSWEGFALNQVVRHLKARATECFFWATHSGAELDLLVVRGRRRLGFEFKRASAPTLTPSMRSALTDLSLSSLTVVHPGSEGYPLAPRVHVAGLERLGELPRL